MIRNGYSHQSSLHGSCRKIETKDKIIERNRLCLSNWIVPGLQYHLHLQHIPVRTLTSVRNTLTVLVYLVVYGIYTDNSQLDTHIVTIYNATIFKMFHNKVVSPHKSYPFSTRLGTEDWKDACSTANVHHNLLQAIVAAKGFGNKILTLPNNKNILLKKAFTQRNRILTQAKQKLNKITSLNLRQYHLQGQNYNKKRVVPFLGLSSDAAL